MSLTGVKPNPDTISTDDNTALSYFDKLGLGPLSSPLVISHTKIDNISTLKGQDNYQQWAKKIRWLLDGISASKVVIEGITPSENASAIENQTHRNICQAATLLLVQSIDDKILDEIPEAADPHRIWKFLESSYYQDNPISFIGQLKRFSSLSLDSNENMLDFLNRFEKDYSLLVKLSQTGTTSSPYRDSFHKFITHDEAKRDYLYQALLHRYPHEIDNLLTKDNVTFLEAKQKLLSLASTQKDGSAEAFHMSDKQSRSAAFCTYCNKHYPGTAQGHWWHQCAQLKKDRENGKQGNSEKDKRQPNTKSKKTKQSSKSSQNKKPRKDDSAHHCSDTDCSDSDSEEANYTSHKVRNLSPWLFDTGTTTHMTPDRQYFSTFQKRTGYVRMGNHAKIRYDGKGDVVLSCVLPDGTVQQNTLREVLWVPSLRKSLLSWTRLKKLGFTMEDKGQLYVRWNDEIVLWAKDYGNLQIVQLIEHYVNTISENCGNYEYWHKALGHPGRNILKNKAAFQDGENILPSAPKNFFCESCTLSKSVHKPPKEKHRRSKELFELIHSDIVGPIPTTSLGGNQYFCTIIEDSTRYTWVYPLRKKSDVADKLENFVRHINTQFGLKIKRLRTDNGGEYISQTLKTFFERKGIVHERTPPYSHESNGVAERLNRTLETIGRSMILDSSMPPFLWAEAIATAAYLKNRQPHKALSGRITPHEALFKEKPEIAHLKPFGSTCYVHIPTEKRKQGDKFKPRAVKCQIVGYTKSSGIYRVYDLKSKQLYETRNLSFPLWDDNPISTVGCDELSDTFPIPSKSDESKICEKVSISLPYVDDLTNKAQSDNAQERSKFSNDSSTINSTAEDYLQISSGRDEHPASNIPQISGSKNREPSDSNRLYTTRSGRISRPPGEWWKVKMADKEIHDDPQTDTLLAEESAQVAAEVFKEEPTSFVEATSGSDADLWEQAIKLELDALERNDTWDVVEKPENRKEIASKWVFKIKRKADGSIERYKARLVAKGFTQRPGFDFDETFAPVVRHDSLRLLIAIAANKGWVPQQLDVMSAFLYGNLREEIYMTLPEGQRIHGKVAKLKKCIYGLKQSPREWYERLIDFLGGLGFKISNFDPCVLVHTEDNFFIAVYVDDLTLFGPPGLLMSRVKCQLKSEFAITDMGDLHWLLGIQIKFSRTGIELSQTAYIDKILDRFGMSDCHPTVLPIDKSVTFRKSNPDEVLEDITTYQRIIGSLMYLVTGSRPDLVYAVTFLSQFCHAPNQQHLKAAKRVLRYVKGTRTLCLKYPYNSGIYVEGYSDSDYGNCLDTRRSISGYIFKVGKCVVAWRSSKQRSVATSSTEAEYMALSKAAKQFLWLKTAFADLRLPNPPMAMFCDNTSAIEIASNNKISDLSKHIDTHYHWIRELVHEKIVPIMYVNTKENPADMCTKGLPEIDLKRHRDNVMCSD